MDILNQFIDRVIAAPDLVWTMALMMSLISGYMLHSFVDDYVFAVVTTLSMFIAIMVAQEAFAEIGVYFTDNKEANIAAAAGASICSVTLMGIILLRIWHAFADFSNRLKGRG